MCTVLLPPGDNPIAVNKYIISYHIPLHIASVSQVTDAAYFYNLLFKNCQISKIFAKELSLTGTTGFKIAKQISIFCLIQ
jgi:hypothetical protein